MSQEGSPFVGQRDAARRTPEERHAEMVLKHIDAPTDRDLVGHGLARDRGEGAAFGDADEPA